MNSVAAAFVNLVVVAAEAVAVAVIEIVVVAAPAAVAEVVVDFVVDGVNVVAAAAVDVVAQHSDRKMEYLYYSLARQDPYPIRINVKH